MISATRRGHDLPTTHGLHRWVKGMRQYRTVLEQKIRERHQTFEEFAETLETFAREHGERGTLSVRHLQRLASGRGPNGRPLGPVQPPTARLLEHILGLNIDELLAPPSVPQKDERYEVELRQRLYLSSQVDDAMLALLQDSLDGIRRLDRQMGAIVAYEEVKTKINQVTNLLTYSVTRTTREPLAALLSELCCLAGWQALDLDRVDESWHHYDNANKAASESGIASFMALSAAGRAFVMADIGESGTAVELAAAARRTADRECSSFLRTWLAAAHGEALAADGLRHESLRAFDQANELLSAGESDPSDPYVALDSVHLARWRGNALVKCGEPDAVNVIAGALKDLNKTFVRAEAGLRVDYAIALLAQNEISESAVHVERARELAEQVGSGRQMRRIRSLTAGVRGTESFWRRAR